jgi:malate dehydrogenase (oxaloacetate-decarboxylating)(NADP+)
LGKAHEVMRKITRKPASQPRRVVFPEGDNERYRSAHILVKEIAQPILLGDEIIEDAHLVSS